MVEEQSVTAHHIIIRTTHGLPSELIDRMIGDSLAKDGIIALYEQEPESQKRPYRDW